MQLDHHHGLHFEATGLVESIHLYGGHHAPAACQVVIAVRIPGLTNGVARYRTTIFKDGQLAELAVHAERKTLSQKRILMTGFPIACLTDYDQTEVVHGSLAPSPRPKDSLDFRALGRIEHLKIMGPRECPISAQIQIICEAPGLPGKVARFRTSIFRQTQLESIARFDGKYRESEIWLQIAGIPLGARKIEMPGDESIVDVVFPTITPAAPPESEQRQHDSCESL